MHYLVSFVFSLLLTLVIEHLAAYIMNERGKRTFLIITLVNVLTNPLAVLSWLIASRVFPGASALSVQLPIEAAVIAAEALVYYAFSLKKDDVIRHPLFLSAVCNICSYGAGLIINKLF